MPFHEICSTDDRRIEPYRYLKFTSDMRRAGRFIAEGDKLVARLLSSGLRVESVLMSCRFRTLGALDVPHDVDIFVAPDAMLHEIVGFKFHRGVLACGVRPSWRSLEAILSEPRAADAAIVPAGSPPISPRHDDLDTEPLTFVVCVDIQDPTNLGTILRTADAFGVRTVLLGGDCADPFSRRVLRVSMGAPFQLPIATSRDLARDLALLRDRFETTLVAATAHPAAEPIEQFHRIGALAILFGNESDGLASEWLDCCDRRITIPMRDGADSLNVSVATGIVLHHVCGRSRASSPSRGAE